MPLVVFILNQISTMPLVNFQTVLGFYQIFGNNKTCDLLCSNVELTTKNFALFLTTGRPAVRAGCVAKRNAQR
jgi:hypothetical protein